MGIKSVEEDIPIPPPVIISFGDKNATVPKDNDKEPHIIKIYCFISKVFIVFPV